MEILQKRNKSIFLLFISISVLKSTDGDYIKCPLVWVNMATGDLPPVSALNVTANKQHLIVRGKISPDTDNQFTIGRYEDGKTFFPSGTNRVEQLDFFEVLTNPHGCVTQWSTGNTNTIHQIPSHPNSGKFVGRSAVVITIFQIKLTLYYSGQVMGRSIQIAVTNDVYCSDKYQVLEAFSMGLTLNLRNFVFDTNATNPSIELLGVDMIYNQADTEITQTITQKRRTLQKTRVTKTSKLEHVFKTSVSATPEFSDRDDNDNPTNRTTAFPLDLSYERQDGRESDSEHIDEQEIIVEVTREISLPPYTSIQACSTLTEMNDYKLSYVARGEYTAPGLTAQEVHAILNGRGNIEGNSVVVEERGTLEGSMSLNTKFFVTEMDDPVGCSGISTAIAKLKRDAAFGRVTKAEYASRNAKIYEMMNSINLRNKFLSV